MSDSTAHTTPNQADPNGSDPNEADTSPGGHDAATSGAVVPDNWADLGVADLEEALSLHNRLYWVDNAPQISDPEFDRLVEALRAKEPDSPALKAIGPAGAGIDLSEYLRGDAQVPHDPPMLSLDKCYEEADLLKWFDKFEGLVIASPKIDGVAASLRYDADGRLFLAATRGTGRVGELITKNVMRIDNVPQTIDTHDIEVRGEAYMPLSVFERRFEDEYSSPRNLTAGALKLKNPAETAGYGVRFFAYDVIGVEFDTESDKMTWLTALGFDTVDWRRADQDQMQAIYDDIQSDRLAGSEQRDYEMDGVVFRADSCAEQRRLGYTSHHPRYSIAYKFQGDSGESVLREVQWNVSRTGAINPVGIVDPVHLSGAEVTRVSLHNLAIMEEVAGDQGLTLGARVMMMRRGGVIPHLESVLEAGDEPVEIPSHCPGCGAETYRNNDVLCADHGDDCRHACLRQLEHFTSKMEIKGVGPKLLEQLFDAGLVSEPSDFFTLTLDELTALERVGETLANKLLGRIDDRREVRVDVFLQALGIDELGRHVAEILADKFDDLDAILSVDAETLVEIPTIGEIIAEKVTAGFRQNAQLIASLREHLELTFPDPTPDPNKIDSPIAAHSFLFTGALESMTRKVAKQRVRELGGDTPSSVIKSLDYLVMGDADIERFEAGWRSSKLKKAEGYNDDGASIAIIGETSFLELLDQ
jgi:DNA ligase (NAD+)